MKNGLTEAKEIGLTSTIQVKSCRELYEHVLNIHKACTVAVTAVDPVKIDTVLAEAKSIGLKSQCTEETTLFREKITEIHEVKNTEAHIGTHILMHLFL